MQDQIINDMLAVLRSVVKNEEKARDLLQQYWLNKIALIWTTENVHQAANERETVLTENEAQEILTNLHQLHNPQYGLQWKDLYEAIEQSGFGRDITKRELNRFVHKDVLAIQKSSRSKLR
jgi:hypothetical protein